MHGGQFAKMMPNFYIVDPNLQNLVGHYFEYDASVARASQEAGYQAILLAHRRIDPAIAARVGAVPTFEEDIWGSGSASKDRIRRGLESIKANLVFCAALVSRLYRAPRGSIVFAHTFIDRQFLGLALLPLLLCWKRSNSYVYLLRYQPSFYATAPARVAFRILEFLAAWCRVRLASDSNRLAIQLEELTSLPIEVLPIPHVPPVLNTGTVARPTARPCRLVSLGNARDEKGIFEILEAIRILHRQGYSDRFHFVLQCNDAAKDVADAIAAFQAERNPNCEFLFETLDSVSYYQHLQSADVVLLPYWRSIYTARTSGVFMEALSAGKPVIVTRDTWMNDQLAQHGAGVLCNDRDPIDLALAIRQAAEELPALAQLAIDRCEIWRAIHNPHSLLQALVAPLPRSGPALPPRRIALFYPWEDFVENRSGASRRCNLLVDFLAPHVEQVKVLQGGAHAPEVMRNCEVSALGPQSKNTRWARLLLRIAVLVASGRRGVCYEWIFWQYARLTQMRHARRRIRRLVRWADIILLEYPFWMSVIAPIAKRVGQPLMKRLAWHIERNALRRADQVVAVSRADQAMLSGHGLAAVLVPNPADSRFFDRDQFPEPRRIISQLYGIELPGQRICLFVGSRHEPNIVAVQHIRDIARMFAGTNVGFVVLGSCAAAERRDNFLALGPVDDAVLLSMYALTDVVLIPLPSGTGASLKTIEAMAAGKVVLGTRVAFRGLDVTSGQHVVIEDGLDQYSNRIMNLLADDATCRRLSAEARRFAADYDYRIAYRAYLDILRIPLDAVPSATGAHPRIDATTLDRTLQASESGV